MRVDYFLCVLGKTSKWSQHRQPNSGGSRVVSYTTGHERVAFRSDNTNVMLGKKNGMAAVLTEVQENLVKIRCACHLISLAAEKGAPCLPAKVDKVLVDIFYYLEKNAKRKEVLRQFQEIHDAEFRKILKRPNSMA